MSLANVLEAEIILYKDLEIYFIDEVVEGFVVLTAHTNVEVNYMGIAFFGEGKVAWNDSTTCSEPSTITVYKAKEEYHGDSRGFLYQKRIIPANIYRYDFKFYLNPNCITSFESTYGVVRYEINFRVNRIPLEELVYKRGVTVLNPNDANTNPIYKVPKQVIGNTTTCCGIVSSRRIFLTMRTPFGVYAPGQRLTYYLELNNKSKKEVLSYKIKFYRIYKFTVKTPLPDEKQIIKKLHSRIRLASSARHHIVYDDFRIPSTPPTLSLSGILSVKYLLTVRARISCSILSTLKLEMEVIIAMAPVSDSVPIKRITPIKPTETTTVAEIEEEVETIAVIEKSPVVTIDAAVQTEPDVENPPAIEKPPVIKTRPGAKAQQAFEMLPIGKKKTFLETQAIVENQPQVETQLDFETEPDDESHPIPSEVPRRPVHISLDSYFGSLILPPIDMHDMGMQARRSFELKRQSRPISPVIKVIQKQQDSPDTPDIPVIPSLEAIEPDIIVEEIADTPPKSVASPVAAKAKVRKSRAAKIMGQLKGAIRKDSPSPEPPIILVNPDGQEEEPNTAAKKHPSRDIAKNILAHLKVLQIEERQEMIRREQAKIRPYGYQLPTRSDPPFIDVDEGDKDYLYGFRAYYPIYKYND